MERTYYDSRGKSHSTEDNAQGANRRYAKENLRLNEESNRLQRAQAEAAVLAGTMALHQLEEQERQNSWQQRHNEDMAQLESARLEAQRQQMQYQRDLACLEGEPAATRAEYLIKRALENAQMPFDEEGFDAHLDEKLGEMAKSRLVDLKAQAATARTGHQTAWQEVRKIAAEVVALDPKVVQTRPQNPFQILGWALGVLGCLFILCLGLSLAHDGGLLPALVFTGFFAAIGSPFVLAGLVWELCRLPKVKRAHQQAQQELEKAWDRKDAAQTIEEDRKTELEQAECQVSEEVGRLKAKLIEYLHTKGYVEFVRAQHPLPSFAEFVWLQVSGFQQDLPPRCKVARDSISVDLCEAHYPMLLDHAVSESIKRIRMASLSSTSEETVGRLGEDAAEQVGRGGVTAGESRAGWSIEGDSASESKLYLFGPDLPEAGCSAWTQGLHLLDELKKRTANHPVLCALQNMNAQGAIWSLIRNGYVLAIKYPPGAFNNLYGDGIVVAAREEFRFPANVVRRFGLNALTPVFWFTGESNKRLPFKEFSGMRLTLEEQHAWDAQEASRPAPQQSDEPTCVIV